MIVLTIVKTTGTYGYVRVMCIHTAAPISGSGHCHVDSDRQGFIQRKREAGISPPLPDNLKICIISLFTRRHKI